MEAGDEALVAALAETASDTGSPLRIEPRHLEAVAGRPDAWALLVEHGRLTARARRFAFNVSCARLDLEEVKRVIADGYAPGDAITAKYHPAIQAATSQLAWVHGFPDFAELAAGFAHMYGHPESTSMTDADLFDEDGSPISFGQANARRLARNATYKIPGPDPEFVSDAQLDRRLAVLDVLAAHGIEPGGYRGEVVTHVVATNRPELLDRLRESGFRTGPRDGSADIAWAMLNECFSMVDGLQAHGHALSREVRSHRKQYEAYRSWREGRPGDLAVVAAAAEEAARPKREPVTWELHGESTLSAELVAVPTAGSPLGVRIAHDNVYGPVDGTQIRIRIGDANDPTSAEGVGSRSDWVELPIVAETLIVDGEEISGDSIEALVHTEAPWRAVHEGTLSVPSGGEGSRLVIEIAVANPYYPELQGVLTDWRVSVDG